jgi:hypothetical protein
MFGFLKMNRSFSLSDSQSISLPMMFSNALLSISTLTPSCSTCSSNIDGLSTYSKWYARPEQPFALVPIRMSFGSGWLSNSRRCATADCESFITAFRGPNLNFRGRKGLLGTASLFCASPSVMLTLGRSCCAACLTCSDIDCAGIESFAAGFPPATEVSGTPAFRGGAGGGCKE